MYNGLIQWPCGPGKENQEFRFVPRGGDRYEIRTGYGNWCVTAAGATDGARMEFHPCDGGVRQQFFIE
ncbi:RICIN domain-containing protein [Streptomyces sp. TRM S81-3]|uniref:RICIN domain-containing protein n=1 Tax=Streptomyces griseicoloratus TaxID=2752516 RepID=A0A926QQD4_9ACTN|nr:RICIN domain-containing protein [Streptomyces griseicoloratus]MBD0420233.1 RICIN domain-containing protein [Streptomyces griseicoloratus]